MRTNWNCVLSSICVRTCQGHANEDVTLFATWNEEPSPSGTGVWTLHVATFVTQVSAFYFWTDNLPTLLKGRVESRLPRHMRMHTSTYGGQASQVYAQLLLLGQYKVVVSYHFALCTVKRKSSLFFTLRVVTKAALTQPLRTLWNLGYSLRNPTSLRDYVIHQASSRTNFVHTYRMKGSLAA